MSLRIIVFIYYPKIKLYEEIVPKDINIYTLKSINFEKNINTVEYIPAITRLCETGKLDFDCYSGECIRETYVNNEDDDDYYEYYFGWKYNHFFYSKRKNIIEQNFTNNKKEFSYIYTREINYECSQDCAINKGKNSLTCAKYYYSNNGTYHYQTKISYDKKKFCYSNNIIFKWRGYQYTRVMLTFSFIKDTYLPSEDSPFDKKLCGILDNYGHKLCLGLHQRCPINKISINEIPNDGHNYTSIEMDNITFYYTNEATKDGAILYNVNVDSKCKNCE